MATRIFAYDGKSWPDPDPTLTTEQVKQNFAGFFPELSTAEIREHKDEKDPETTIYELVRKTGTKGAIDLLTPPMVVSALKTVKEFHIDLIDLSWKVVNNDGQVDDTKLAVHMKEIEAAADQATAYVDGCRRVTQRLLSFRRK